jgi:hypothetical protein
LKEAEERRREGTMISMDRQETEIRYQKIKGNDLPHQI